MLVFRDNGTMTKILIKKELKASVATSTSIDGLSSLMTKILIKKELKVSAEEKVLDAIDGHDQNLD